MSLDNCTDEQDTDTEQSVRDANGRFAPGNKPAAGFDVNPQNRSSGSWRKEDTPRYKLEQMMTLTEAELSAMGSASVPLFERKLAKAIIDGSWIVIRDMIHEVYGNPKDSVDLNADIGGVPIIKGFILPTAPEDFIDKDIREQLGEEEAARVLGVLR